MSLSYILLQADGANAANIFQYVLLGGMFIVFYFFIMRPQQQKQAKQKEFLNSLKKGDNAVTIGGLHGKIAAIEGDIVYLEVDKTLKLKFDKSSISMEASALLRKNELTANRDSIEKVTK